MSRGLWAAGLIGLVVCSCKSSVPVSPETISEAKPEVARDNGARSGCSEKTTEVGGVRRIALLIGVGRYLNPKITTLKGPPLDVEAMYRLLSGPNGYEFPRENICVLLEKDATVAGVTAALAQLAARIRGPEDQVLLYYSGHGSQVKDENGDEPDGRDETLVLHDSLTRGVGELTDDVLSNYLEQIHRKTKNLVTIFDSCHSGSVTRAGASADLARWVDPELPRAELSAETVSAKSGDHGESWTPYYSDLVQLSGATDGTEANEPRAGGNGYFTAALVSALAESSREARTWGQISRQVLRAVEVSSKNKQIPRFQGALDKVVFSSAARSRPQTWEISALDGETVKLVGLPTPGFGLGALLSVYPAAVAASELRDPSKSIATLEVVPGTNAPFEAQARIQEKKADPVLGDRVVLLLASREQHRLRVSLTVPADTRAALDAELSENTRARAMMTWVEAQADFQLGASSDGTLIVRGADGSVRNIVQRGPKQSAAVITILENHARQLSLLSLSGEGGGDFQNDQTLKVEFVPAARQPACARPSRNSCTGEIQNFPVCADMEIRVTNTHPSLTLFAGGVVLFNDGNYNGVPVENNTILQPGRSAVLGTIRTAPPYNIAEHVLIFGTQQDNIVPWGLVASGDGTRGDRDVSPLQSIVGEYLAGTRSEMIKPVKRSTWTSTHRSFRVVPNPDFAALGSDCAQPPDRDRSLANFELLAYQPENSGSALGQLLKTAGELTGTEATEAMEQLFSRTGLSKDALESCGSSALQTGDLLTYRGTDAAGKIHSFEALLIEPQRRLVWSPGPPKSGEKSIMGFDQIPSDLRAWKLSGAKLSGCRRLAGESELPRYLLPQTFDCTKVRCTE